MEKASEELRAFLYENVYIDSLAKKEEDKAINLVKSLFAYYMNNPTEVIPENKSIKSEKEQLVVDYIAGMTDTYAIKNGRNYLFPYPGKKTFKCFWSIIKKEK